MKLTRLCNIQNVASGISSEPAFPCDFLLRLRVSSPCAVTATHASAQHPPGICSTFKGKLKVSANPLCNLYLGRRQRLRGAVIFLAQIRAASRGQDCVGIGQALEGRGLWFHVVGN